MKIFFIWTSTLLINYNLFSQRDFDAIIQNNSQDILIENLNTPIHKATSYDSILWCTDYGTGTIYKSIDNGKTFKAIATLGSEYFESIQFLDENIGFISGDYGFVYKTTDGGQNWTEISPTIENRITERYRNDSTKNQQPDGQFAAYYGMHFTSPKTGFVSGFTYNPSIGFSNSYKQVFYSTNDGGDNWSLLDKQAQQQEVVHAKNNLTTPFTYIQNEYFLTPDISWKTEKGRNKCDLLIKENHATESIDTLQLPKTPYQKVMLRNITFVSNEIGFLFGGSIDKEKAIIYNTMDGGENWELIESKLDHIHTTVANDHYLFLFGKNGLMKRIDKSIILKH